MGSSSEACEVACSENLTRRIKILNVVTFFGTIQVGALAVLVLWRGLVQVG
jgi:hypothetical protein